MFLGVGFCVHKLTRFTSLDDVAMDPTTDGAALSLVVRMRIARVLVVRKRGSRPAGMSTLGERLYDFKEGHMSSRRSALDGSAWKQMEGNVCVLFGKSACMFVMRLFARVRIADRAPTRSQ